MKFITEEDLRDLYRKEPFTSYDLDPGARLTPGARQFLSDRGINMFDNISGGRKNPEESKPSDETKGCGIDWKNRKLFTMLNSIEALFLLTAEELLKRDVCLAQSIIGLGRQFSSIKNALKCGTPVENLVCHECTGMKEDNFSSYLEDCFEITEFHMQLEKGRELMVLHRLRCVLHEIEPAMRELLASCNDTNALCEDSVSKINQIINRLSQLICSTFGGKKCQRQD